MSTRLYLSGRVASGTPGADAQWEKATGFVRRNALTGAQGNAFASISIAAQGTSGNDTLLAQFISPPLSGAQTITGTFKGQMRFNESSASLDSRSQIVIKVLQSDLSTVRGTLYAGDTAALANEWATSLTNRRNPRTAGSAISSVSAQDGDYIVIEVGARQHATFAGNLVARYGDASASDLPENESATTEDNPWIEFSQTLTFKDITKLRVTQVAAESLYAQDITPKLRVTQVAAEVLYVDTMTGRATGSSSGSASLRLLELLNGTANGASTAAAAMALLELLAAEASGSSSGSAAIELLDELTGNASGVSSASALMDLVESLTALAGGSSAAEALLELLIDLASSVNGASGADSELTIESGSGEVLFAGTVTGASSAAAGLALELDLSTDAHGHGSAIAHLTVAPRVRPTPPVGITRDRIRPDQIPVVRYLEGRADGSAQAKAQLTLAAALSGVARGRSAAEARLRIQAAALMSMERDLRGSSSAAATASGTLSSVNSIPEWLMDEIDPDLGDLAR